VRAIDAATGEGRELFTIENGTTKFLSPALSPDGQWIAYRGADNSSLYLVRLDGSDEHRIMTGVGQVVWSRSG
jgi:Tol biopolymer transport system component